jgi:lipid-A-disaccharide synthase
MRVPHISLVNLIAKQEVFPEYLTEHDVSPQMADHVLNWLNDESRRQAVVRVLGDLSRQYAIPGACDRAADFLTERVGAVNPLRQAA